jgi:hypothetical protein
VLLTATLISTKISLNPFRVEVEEDAIVSLLLLSILERRSCFIFDPWRVNPFKKSVVIQDSAPNGVAGISTPQNSKCKNLFLDMVHGFVHGLANSNNLPQSPQQ